MEHTLYFGADHRGFEAKQALMQLCAGCHPFLQLVDLGPEEYNPDDDYNDMALAVAQAVLADAQGLGVLICGSAHGVTMQANRVRGIRAIHATTPASAAIGREHDHANILCLSADAAEAAGDGLDAAAMEAMVKAFCHARPSAEERYRRRAARLDEES